MFLLVFLVIAGAVSIETFKTPGIYQVTPPLLHSECPTWESRKGLLYYVNIPFGEIYSYDYQTEELWMIKVDGEVAPVVPSKNNSDLLIIGLSLSIAAVQWDGRSNSSQGTKILADISQPFPSSKVNEGKADRDGRFWIGTMGYAGPDGINPNEGILFRLTKEDVSNPVPMIAPVTVSNGLTWNKANNRMYYIDSPTGQIVEYLYDSSNGNIEFNRVVFDIALQAALTGSPDGMTIDIDDNLWVALYGGGAVLKVDPNTGEVLQVVALPALLVTSVVWGGPDLDILFVSTSRISLNEQQQLEQPAAGSIFAVVGLGTKGLPMYEADLINSL